MTKQVAGHNWYQSLNEMLLHLKSGQEISAEELDEMVNTILLCKDTLDFIKQHDPFHCPDLYTVDKLTSLLKYIMLVNG